MATTFPSGTYRISGDTAYRDSLNVSRDVSDDGTPFVRVLGADTFRTINLVFSPLTEDEQDALLLYLAANRATEFDVTIDGAGDSTYRGYFWSEPETTVGDGFYAVQVEFYGRRL